jgi:hypothetical protein
MGPGGVNQNPLPPGAPEVPGFVVTGKQAGAAGPPAPSDDAGISPEMRAAMQPTKDAQAALDAEQKKYEDLAGKASALKPPSSEDYKPPLWKKIAAPLVGALAGRNAEAPVNAMLNGPYNRAMQDYEAQSGQLQKQLEAERGIGIPLAESRARVAQEGFSNQMNLRKEGETEKRDQNRNEYENDLNEIRKAYDEGRIQDAQTRLNETAEKNKNDNARANEILELRKSLVDVAQQNADTRSNAAGGNAGGLTASEQREFNSKTRRYSTEIDALNRERAQMVGIEGDFAKKRTAAIDTRLDELHSNIDKAEDDIISKRPVSKSGAQGNQSASGAPKGFQAPAGAPAPTKEGQILRDKTTKKVVAISTADKAGKFAWGPPQ